MLTSIYGDTLDTPWKINKDWKGAFETLLLNVPTDKEKELKSTINCYYSPRKKMSQMLLTAFIQGSRGFLHNIDDVTLPKRGISVAFGRDTIHKIIKPCLKMKSELIYIDHAYFDRGYKNKFDTHKSPPNFRIIKNGIHLSKLVDRPDDRFKSFNINLEDWKQKGDHILICPPTGYLEQASDLNPAWLEDTLELLRMHTDRPILIRPKPGITRVKRYHLAAKRCKNVRVLTDTINKPLKDDLNNCWAMVAPASGALIESVIHGIPIFCEPISPAASVATLNYSEIETPIYPEREQLMYNLAYSQFNLIEIATGVAFKAINEI